MRFLSVCSGIEAASCAWEPLGWRCAGLSEIEAFPRAVLEQRLGALPVDFEDHRFSPNSNTLPLFGDFTQIEDHHVGAIDLIVGGTPCQDYSIAGLRAGLDGNRGNLTLAFSDLAYRTRARWMVWENVPGALSTNEGRDFGAILATFSGRHGLVFEPPVGGWSNAGIVEPADACSYGIAWRVLDAQYFGVPQRRRRVFIVGYIGDWRPAAAVLFERESLSGHPAPRREKGQVAPTIPSRSLGGGGLGTDFEVDGGLIPADVDGVVGTLSRQDHGGVDTQTALSGYLRPAKPPVQVDGGMGSRPKAADAGHVVAFSYKDSGCDATDDVSPTLRSLGGYDANGGGQMAVAFAQNQRGEARTMEIAGALAAEPGMKQQTYIAQSAVRRLTPRECERLQGFPDDFTRIAWRGKPADECPDGPRYKALGNSMAVPVMRWIGTRIDMVEALIR